MKKEVAAQFKPTDKKFIGRIFLSEDAASQQTLVPGTTYDVHKEVIDVVSPGLERPWQGIRLDNGDVSEFVSPRTVCGLAFVNKKLQRVVEKSVRGDLLKLMEAGLKL